MTKRILVLPDVHGRLFWKEPVQKYIDVVDRVVFLGDYLDPYGDEGGDYDAESIFENLKEIVELKRNNMDKVVLLKGNHDQHYASSCLMNLLAVHGKTGITGTGIMSSSSKTRTCSALYIRRRLMVFRISSRTQELHCIGSRR